MYEIDCIIFAVQARERAGVVTDTLPFGIGGPTVEPEDYGATEEHIIEKKYNCSNQENNVSETSFSKEGGPCHAPQGEFYFDSLSRHLHYQNKLSCFTIIC